MSYFIYYIVEKTDNDEIFIEKNKIETFHKEESAICYFYISERNIVLIKKNTLTNEYFNYENAKWKLGETRTVFLKC